MLVWIRRKESRRQRSLQKKGYEKEVISFIMCEEVSIMRSESIFVEFDARWKLYIILELIFFVHIFEGNPNMRNEYPVEIFWSIEKTNKIMHLPLIMQMF